MSKDNVLSALRSFLKIGGAVLLAVGLVNAGQWEAISASLAQIVGAGMTLSGLFWSLWHHTPDGQGSPLALMLSGDAAARENILSLARSALKIVGALLLTFGVGTAGQVDALGAGVVDIVGTVLTLSGIFWSLWNHTPDGEPVMKLRTLDPMSLPADVRERMAATAAPQVPGAGGASS